MSEPFVAEIRIFAGNFAPRGWAACNGQLLPIAQNTALFSLVGTIYGGDGRTVFGLPNLQGRAPMHPGRGPGLTFRRIGESGGTETVTLSEAQMPAHSHSVSAGLEAQSSTPDGNYLGQPESVMIYHTPVTPDATLAGTQSATGGSQAHNNMQPYLVLNFIIALVGLFPSRS